MAASKQSEIAIYDVVRFLPIKCSFGIIRNTNVNIEFLKVATLKPIFSAE